MAPLLLLWVSRFVFVAYNRDMFEVLTVLRLLELSVTGIKFDLCAWAWFNSLFIFLRFLPFDFVNDRRYKICSGAVYITCNFMMLLPALADIPFFRFNGSRLRWQTITNLWSDPEMGHIILSFVKDYRWCFIFALILIFILYIAVFGIKLKTLRFREFSRRKTTIIRGAVFLFVAGGTFLCIRGHVRHVRPGRPLSIGDLILMNSPYYASSIDSPAALLNKKGYATRFYFGGNRGSFNIDQTLRAAGFEKIMCREDYGMDRDFDGQWGVWDHKMAEFAVNDISKLPQPFFAGWFTLNPHGPYGVPKDWNTEGYRSADEMLKTVEYEDRAIEYFFKLAEKEAWFRNTIFIIIGDHGFRDLSGTVYDSRYILPHIMLMIYAPDGSLTPRRMDYKFVTQFDIPPTILSLAGYPDGYVALGQDIMSEDESYAIMYIKGAYQVCGPKYALRLSNDFKRVEGVYDRQTDYEMKNPLREYDPKEVTAMVQWAQTLMQDYTTRLNNNRFGS